MPLVRTGARGASAPMFRERLVDHRWAVQGLELVHEVPVLLAFWRFQIAGFAFV